MKLLCALPLVLLAARAQVLPADFSLTFSRGGCLGVCLASTLTIDRDGVVNFHVGFSQRGAKRRRMTPAEREQLIGEIDRFDFFNHELPSNGRHVSNDGPDDSLSIRLNGREHTVRTFGFSDLQFRRFGNRIEALALHRLDWEEQHRAINYFAPDRCKSGNCPKEAVRLAHESLLLVRLGYPTNREAVVSAYLDGSVRLRPRQVQYVYEMWSRLSPERLRELRDAIAELKTVKSVSEPDGISWPEKWLYFVVPKGDALHIIESPLSALSPRTAAIVEKLVDDRAYISDAKSIRVEILDQGAPWPAHPWPAEDLVPAAQLAKRTFTPAEWSAIVERLEVLVPSMESAPFLDGKAFGVANAVYLRVVTSAK